MASEPYRSSPSEQKCIIMIQPNDTSAEPLRLLCVLAHPDDESLAVGGVLARYAAEGIATYLITATRGERGWQGTPETDPGPVALARIRADELQLAAAILGLREVRLLSYGDGQLAEVDWTAAIAAVVGFIRKIRPHVVITFGPDGATGHPDHIAISQITTAAVVCASDPTYRTQPHELTHRVIKLYYYAESRERARAFAVALGSSTMTVDGSMRHCAGWDSWAITTRIDTGPYVQQVVQAISCHRSQLPSMPRLKQLSDEQHHIFWGVQEFYRVFSLECGGRALEDDLFAGLRHPAPLEQT
jgi:LmbE family N-acetylglucosaminyl deacetylase